VSALLEARCVSHSYGETRVLEDASLALEPGELLVMLGPNGAGKTTLLRALAGLLEPRRGDVSLRGASLRTLTRRQLALALAIVPQELVVPFPYRVHELVAMGRAPHLGAFGREGPRDRAAIDRALARVGLGPLAQRSYATLSGGEKQRVALARALAQDVDLLLLDEPTAHMDLGHRLHTFEWLRAWIAERRDSRAVLAVTHDLALAAHFGDRIGLLSGGRVLACGAPRDVLTRERIAAVYGVDARVEYEADGAPRVVALRSRIGYIREPDEPHR
jgi:iron complex transport system ATP-binding protein